LKKEASEQPPNRGFRQTAYYTIGSLMASVMAVFPALLNHVQRSTPKRGTADFAAIKLLSPSL
jgi:hypothetical protein